MTKNPTTETSEGQDVCARYFDWTEETGEAFGEGIARFVRSISGTERDVEIIRYYVEETTR